MLNLLNPKLNNREYSDEVTKELCEKTIEWFESKGIQEIKTDDQKQIFYEDFLEFQHKNQIFAKFLTPSEYSDDPDARWDTWRICQYNEILSFYGLAYWYTWQVSILGLGPIWQSENMEMKQRAAKLLKEGNIFAYGLSEQQHGADIYSSEMKLTPQEDGTYLANGEKYYIGNGNKARMVSTFGRISDNEGNFLDKDPHKDKSDYVFFVANYEKPNYDLIKDIVRTQSYVANYALKDYPVTKSEILQQGQAAWDACMNTVNIGKFNLGWASIGMCTHSFYEALNHASKRILFGHAVTDFSHIKQYFVEAYLRLVSMKLFALRGIDYMRSASKRDKRYMLYNPMVKMMVTLEGEVTMNLLFDIIAAKGFEKDNYFEMAIRDIRALPKLEGTVHVNMALVIKFMTNYFINPKRYPETPKRDDPKNDDFLFDQGPARGLGKIRFHDYNETFNSVDLPNVNIFKKQIQAMVDFSLKATPTMEQGMDLHFTLQGGRLFALIVYGQLLIESAQIWKVDDFILDQIFANLIKDFSSAALELYSSPTSNEKQEEYLLKAIHKPNKNTEQFEKIWNENVFILKDVYKMND